ncbi:hypothetical protein RmaAA338_05800 [Rhodothermus marinus]|nr:hypothetical protein RmaAA338_05800 [Rhodothermus marinus]
MLEAFFGLALGFDELGDGGLQALEPFFGAAVRFDELLHQFGKAEQFFAQDEPAQLGPPLRMGLQESNEVVKVLNFERHGLSLKDLLARQIRTRWGTVSDRGGVASWCGIADLPVHAGTTPRVADVIRRV